MHKINVVEQVVKSLEDAVFVLISLLFYFIGVPNPFTNESQLNQPTMCKRPIQYIVHSSIPVHWLYTRYSFLMIQLNIHVYKCV